MLEQNFIIKANAEDWSKQFTEEHLEAQGFTAWDVKVKLEEQSPKSIVVDIEARGTGLIVTVSACRIYEPLGLVPVCYSVPESHIAGFTAATKQDLIHQIAEQMARANGTDDVDGYRVDAVSIGTVVYYLEETLKKGLN